MTQDSLIQLIFHLSITLLLCLAFNFCLLALFIEAGSNEEGVFVNCVDRLDKPSAATRIAEASALTAG